MDVSCSFSLSDLHNLHKSTLDLISISLGRPLFNVPLSAVDYFARTAREIFHIKVSTTIKYILLYLLSIYLLRLNKTWLRFER